MNGNKFSKREWLFFIAVIMMIEYWLISVSYEFVDWQQVVNFISFAAAIASILLAIIAIIHGFIQSDSNSKTTGMLREQAESLKLHTQSLSESSESITDHLSSIATITARLDTLDDNIRKSVEKMSGVEKTVEGIHASNKELMNSVREKRAEAEPTIKPSGDSIDHNDLIDVIFTGSSFELDALGYALYKYLLSQKEVTIAEFASVFDRVVDKADGSGMDIFFNIESVLRAIGLIKGNDLSKTLVIDKKFEKILSACAEEAKKSDHAKVAKMLRRVDQIIDEIE
jgi:hypothetical protein